MDCAALNIEVQIAFSLEVPLLDMFPGEIAGSYGSVLGLFHRIQLGSHLVLGFFARELIADWISPGYRLIQIFCYLLIQVC